MAYDYAITACDCELLLGKQTRLFSVPHFAHSAAGSDLLLCLSRLPGVIHPRDLSRVSAFQDVCLASPGWRELSILCREMRALAFGFIQAYFCSKGPVLPGDQYCINSLNECPLLPILYHTTNFVFPADCIGYEFVLLTAS